MKYAGRLNLAQLWAGNRCILRRHSPVPEIKYSRQKTTRVDWWKDSAHIGEYNASHYWNFYQNKKQMCRMLTIINTFQKKNFIRSWKILLGTSWVTFGFPRLFVYWYLWKCVNVFYRRYLPQKNSFENGSWDSVATLLTATSHPPYTKCWTGQLRYEQVI
jgi:hypothetical protein